MNIKVSISVGELLDKISILEIKSKFTNNEYVLKELKELKEISHSISYPEEYMNDLRIINQKLWNIEDRLRVLENEKRFDEEFIELARSVYITNDERARIKRKINEITKSNYREIKVFGQDPLTSSVSCATIYT
jgi:hypothetical protein